MVINYALRKCFQWDIIPIEYCPPILGWIDLTQNALFHTEWMMTRNPNIVHVHVYTMYQLHVSIGLEHTGSIYSYSNASLYWLLSTHVYVQATVRASTQPEACGSLILPTGFAGGCRIRLNWHAIISHGILNFDGFMPNRLFNTCKLFMQRPYSHAELLSTLELTMPSWWWIGLRLE